MTPHEFLQERYPPLKQYVPIFDSLSAPQIVFLLDDSREVLYGGAVGGGKSAAILAAALRYVHMPNYSALLLRRTYPELEKSGGLIPLADEWLANTDARRSDGGKKWKFPSGARLEFGHVQHEHDKTQYQGAAYTMVGFDELTHFTESIYDYIGFSRQRRDMRVRAPIQTLSTANPGGVGHMWVKDRFIKERKPGLLFVPAKVADNPAWRPGEYEASLSYLNDELRRQLLEGDWEAFADQAFGKFGEHNLIDRFPLEEAHLRVECADWGFNGTAWHLLVKDYEGNYIFYDSYYTDKRSGNPDGEMPSAVAREIRQRRKIWGKDNRAEMDPSVWRRSPNLNKWGQPASAATEFEENGVSLSPANNDPRAGYTRLREAIEPDPAHHYPSWHPNRGRPGAPRAYFVRGNCPELIEQMKAAPIQPIEKTDGGEKVNPDWEGAHGHAVAAARYGMMSWDARPSSSMPADYSPLSPDEWAREQRKALLRLRHRRAAEGYEKPGRYVQL